MAQKYILVVHFVDLVKSFPTSIYYILANIGVDTAENEPLRMWRCFNSFFIRLLSSDATAYFCHALSVDTSARTSYSHLATGARLEPALAARGSQSVSATKRHESDARTPGDRRSLPAAR